MCVGGGSLAHRTRRPTFASSSRLQSRAARNACSYTTQAGHARGWMATGRVMRGFLSGCGGRLSSAFDHQPDGDRLEPRKVAQAQPLPPLVGVRRGAGAKSTTAKTATAWHTGGHHQHSSQMLGTGRDLSGKPHASEIRRSARTFIPHARSRRLEQRLGKLAKRRRRGRGRT